jgi:hypothetical protein
MRITTALFLAASVAATSGCSGCKSSSTKAGDDAGQAAAPGQPGVPSPIAMPSAAPGATVPEDFPKVVPIYPGARVVAATKGTGPAGKSAWTVGLVANDEKNVVFTFFRANLSAFKQMSDSVVGPARTGTWQNPQYDVTVTVGDSPDKHTSIAMAVNAKQ